MSFFFFNKMIGPWHSFENAFSLGRDDDKIATGLSSTDSPHLRVPSPSTMGI